MRLTPRLFVLVLSAAAAACGDDAPKSGTPSVTPPRTGTASAAGPRSSGSGPAAGTSSAEPPRTGQPVEQALPDAPPLSVDAAQRILIDAIDAAPDSVVVREALSALAATAGADAVRAAAVKLLEKGDGAGGYADPEAAASALGALSAAGDAEAGARAVLLARAGIEADLVFESYVPMLVAVKGAAQTDARALLLRLAEHPVTYAEAIEALARLRDASAAARFHEVATDTEEEGGVRALAAAGLLAIGDGRATAVAETLVKATETELTSFDVMDGLAVAGIEESLPWIHRIADPVITEGENCTIEIATLAEAYVDVRGAGGGTPADMTALNKLAGLDESLSDPEVFTALWTLGDDKRAGAAADLLAQQVTGLANSFDAELGVRLLTAVAARKAGAASPFSRVVSAAAAVAITEDAKHPERAVNGWRMRVAAARARLASR